MSTLAPVEALRHNRAVREAYVDLGLMFLERGQPELALGSLERVLEASPEDHDALAAKARALASLERYQEASDLFAELLKREARSETFIERARCLAALGRVPEALACIDVARVSVGDSLDLELEAIHYERRLEHYKSALERNLRLIGLHSGNLELLEARGDLYAESGDFDEAYRAYEHALLELDRPGQGSSLRGRQGEAPIQSPRPGL